MDNFNEKSKIINIKTVGGREVIVKQHVAEIMGISPNSVLDLTQICNLILGTNVDIYLQQRYRIWGKIDDIFEQPSVTTNNDVTEHDHLIDTAKQTLQTVNKDIETRNDWLSQPKEKDGLDDRKQSINHPTNILKQFWVKLQRKKGNNI